MALDPSEHGAGRSALDGGANQQVDGGSQSSTDGSSSVDEDRDAEAIDATDPPDLADAGDGDASDPFVPPEGCEDVDVDEACLAIDCGALPHPRHGRASTPEGSTFGQVADYTCDEGYGVVGVSRRTCLANGEWSDSAPSCEPGDCETLQSPDNGVVNTPEGTAEGASATYSCNLGYALIGAETRTCQEDKTWSGSAASCDFADECDGENPCGEGSCVNGAGYGYDCECAMGYADDGSSFPSCEAAPVLSLTGESNYDFAPRERGTNSSFVDWTITNIGMAATGALSVATGDEPDFELDNLCTSSLEPGESCTLRVRFTPQNYGTLDDTLTVSSARSNELEIYVRGSSQVRITVEIDGTGSVTADGIDCPGTCSALFDYESTVTLTAHTTNGSNHYLSAWLIDDCKGPSRDCVVAAIGSRSVGVAFSPMTHNLVFVTSDVYPADLGSAAAYDARCNEAASAAGLNNAAGNGYIASTSDEGTRFMSRLGGSVRGWVRLDGRPFAATATALDEQILHPVLFDARGWEVETWSWTGHNGNNCNSWTTTASDVRGWLGHPNVMRWNLWAADPCDQEHALICLGNTQTAALDLAATPGKRIWVSAPYLPGTEMPDARCLQDRPSGVAEALALISYTDRAASSLLDPEANYVRPDGQLVGTGQDMIDGRIYAGIWQLGDGTFNFDWHPTVWTGSFGITELGDSRYVCDDWTSSSADNSGLLGSSEGTLDRWWSAGGAQACTGPGEGFNNRIYCIEPP